jgi:hypothetical protein
LSCGLGLPRYSRCKGAYWDKKKSKWWAQCKGTHLGYHTTEEAAARAYNKYLKDGIHPGPKPARSSQFKGVTWHKSNNTWKAVCNNRHLGYHATEEDAARAHSKYLEDGIDPVKRREANTSRPRSSRVSAGTKKKTDGVHNARGTPLAVTPWRKVQCARTTLKLSALVSPSTSSRPSEPRPQAQARACTRAAALASSAL